MVSFRALVALTLVLISCSTAVENPVSNNRSSQPGLGGLPLDGLQPWEELDRSGHVAPARQASAFAASSEFAPGVERFADDGAAVEVDEALAISSPPGSNQVAYAIYRFVMGGVQPSAIAVDANLKIVDSNVSEYWVGLSNYGNGTWEWRGPYTDGQAVINIHNDELRAGDYLSPLGNTFVAIAAHNGAALDLVGLTVGALDGSDSAAPPAPAAPLLTPVTGGLEVQWLPVIAADLAGYQIYWSHSPFAATTDSGVQQHTSLENSDRMILPVKLSRTVWVALAAVDVNGNVSELSPTAEAKRLTGEIPPLELTLSTTSVPRGAPVTLTVSGAETVDYDLDGDGIFEITGAAPGSQPVDTSGTGLIRPRVRGTTDGGQGVAMGSVTLIVTGNQRPVANALVTPQMGVAPLDCDFNGTGEDFDGTIAEYAWDFDGDGIYDHNSPADGITNEGYSTPGVYNAKLRVTDDLGAWDVDTVTVVVNAAVVEVTLSASPSGVMPGEQISLSAVTSEPASAFQWDLDGNNTFETSTGNTATATATLASPGIYTLGVQATLPGGIATSTVTVSVHGPFLKSDIDKAAVDSTSLGMVVHDGRARVAYKDGNVLKYVKSSNDQGTGWHNPIAITDGVNNEGAHCSLAIVGGVPAVCYFDDTDDDLEYRRANDIDGSTWSDAEQVDPLAAGSLTHTSMAVVAGRPAISYQSGGDLYFVRAADATGESWLLPELVDNGDTGTVGGYTSLAVVNGRPAIAYHGGNGLKYVRAADENGSGWPAATSLHMPSNSNNKIGHFGTTLLVVDGFPAISYYDGHEGDLKYVRALDADGTSWGAKIAIDTDWDAGFNNSMAIVGGVPTIAYHANIMTSDFYLRVVRAVNPQGTAWGEPVVLHPLSGWQERQTRVVSVMNKPGIGNTLTPSGADVEFNILF